MHRTVHRIGGPRGRVTRRRRGWWTVFASPWWLVGVAPVMLLPVWLMVFYEPAREVSSIDQAIAALPLPGDVAVGEEGVAVFGTKAGGVPPTVALRLYANSARVTADRPPRRDDGPDLKDRMLDYEAAAYAVLHPRSLAGEDLLVGDYALLTRALMPDLSFNLLAEFCSARPEDPYYAVKLSELPLSEGMLLSLGTLGPGSSLGSFCKRFG